MTQGIFESGKPINLAYEPVFKLGSVQVFPSTRQIVRDGKSETLEPRVMQVLVTLAQAEGAVVTSDELIERCWGGRIVGENAIHRVISRVRHVAATIGGGSFRIETIAKVGYRLLLRDAPGAMPLERRPGPAVRRRGGLAIVIVVIALSVAAAIFAIVLWPHPPRADPTVAIVAAGTDAQSTALARSLSVDVNRFVGARPIGLALIEPTAGQAEPVADYSVRVGVHAEAGGLRADLSLQARPGALTLWSASIETPTRELGDLRQQTAAALGLVLACLGDGGRSDARELDPEALRLYLPACGISVSELDATQLGPLRRITALAPDFAPGWARLALVEALTVPGDGPAMAAQRAAAVAHIDRARALAPGRGETYLAEAAVAAGSDDWAARLAIFDRGIALDLGYAPLHTARSFELTRVGRMQEAVRAARRAVALNPLSVDDREALVSALAYTGATAAAAAELDRAERLWPGTRILRALRYRFELRFGDPRRALAFQSQPDLFDMENPPTDRAFEAFLRARLDPSPATIDRAVAAFMPRYPDRVAGLIQTLAYFGRIDEVYRLLALPRALAALRSGSEVLFRPHMRLLRNDRRFIALSARLGLLRYWQRSGVWPDFCLEPSLPYHCRTEAGHVPAAPS